MKIENWIHGWLMANKAKRDKQLDCEGIDISTEKGKVDIVETEELDTLKLIDEKTGELLLECKVGDKYHQALLEIGLNTILEKYVNENDWESKVDKEWTPLEEPTGDDVAKALGHMDKDGKFIK